MSDIPYTGLTSSEVEAQKAAGHVNAAAAFPSKSVWEIIKTNVFTLFNLINIILFVFIMLAGSPKNALFMVIIFANMLIGIIQELRAKHTLTRLRVLTAAKALVVRDGIQVEIPAEELVQGDVYILTPGSQIAADAEVLQSSDLEVDESLLTGESHSVHKLPGDEVLSGSFVVAGRSVTRVSLVGMDSYANRITAQARTYKRVPSEIRNSINRITKYVSIIIIPIGLLLFFSQYFREAKSWQDALVGSAAGIIGMIPEGLVLLTSVALAVGVMKLARKRTLVQELTGIEVLARVDVLCLDKTGTLTQDALKVDDVQLLGHADSDYVEQALFEMTNCFEDRNATARAIWTQFKREQQWRLTASVPFSSARKWSGARFDEQGSFAIGAAEYMGVSDELFERAQDYAKQGYRVLILAHLDAELSPDGELSDVTPLAMVLLCDSVRPEAADTVRYFKEQEVELRIISGDNPDTVANVAAQVGIDVIGAPVDMTGIDEADEKAIAAALNSSNIYGRVTPAQKKALVKALQAEGHVVAMTGDGVNDVLALRESDCSIAMASGAGAARNAAQIVLLDSDFSTLPSVVLEGRQVINNIERVANLYLMKTLYSMLLSVCFILLGRSFPFEPIHQTLIGSATVGIPTFFLALEKNPARIKPGFLQRILDVAVPSGLTITLVLLAIELVSWMLRMPRGQEQFLAVAVTGFVSIYSMYRISRPLNLFRTLLLSLTSALFLVAMLVFPEFFELGEPTLLTAVLVVLFAAVAVALRRVFASNFYKIPVIKKLRDIR